MNARPSRSGRARRWARRSSALLLVGAFLLAGATAGFAYWVVTAINSPGTATALAASLSAPTAPTATVNDSGSISIGWTLPGTQLAGAQYQVMRTSPGTPVAVCTVASPACTDTGLTGGTTYGYSIAAVLGTSWQSVAITTSATTTKASQTISFTSTAPGSATVGGPTYTVTATASSGLSVTFSIDASSTSVCSIAGSTVGFTAVGTCKIDANQAGNPNYLPAPQVQQSFAVAKGSQVITFTSTAPSATVGGSTYTVTASGGASSSPVTFTLDGTSSGCSLAGSTVSFTAVGTCKIDANQAADVNYNAAPQVQQSFAVAKGAQTITFTSAAPSASVGGATYTVTATGGGSLNAVAFTLDGTSTGCSLAGSTVSFTAVGTCKIDANQAGNANYNAAPQAQQSFAVAKGTQIITFTSTAPGSATVGGATYAVSASSTSGLTVAITSGTTPVCTISGSTVTFVGAGTCTLDANQAGDANWNAASQVTQSFAVAKGTQIITFTSTAPGSATVGGATYAVSASSTSGLTVAITSGTTPVCTISGSTVTFVGAGTCTLDANQTGDANWTAASQVTQSFAVAKGTQIITFTSTAPSSATVGGATYAVSASSSSGLTVALTSGTTPVCTISGSTVSFITVGTCTLDANQTGDANWNAASQVQQSFAVGKGTQILSFTSTAPASATVGGATYTVTASSTSGLTVAITSGATAVCTISGSTVTFVGAGTCTLNANQAGNANWNVATQVQQSFTVTGNVAGLVWTNVKVNGSAATPTCTGTIGSTYTCTVSGTSNNDTITANVAFANSAGTPTVFSTTAGSTVNIVATGKGTTPATVTIPANQTTSTTTALAQRNGSNSAQITATFGSWTAVLIIQ